MFFHLNLLLVFSSAILIILGFLIFFLFSRSSEEKLADKIMKKYSFDSSLSLSNISKNFSSKSNLTSSLSSSSNSISSSSSSSPYPASSTSSSSYSTSPTSPSSKSSSSPFVISSEESNVKNKLISHFQPIIEKQLSRSIVVLDINAVGDFFVLLISISGSKFLIKIDADGELISHKKL